MFFFTFLPLLCLETIPPPAHSTAPLSFMPQEELLGTMDGMLGTGVKAGWAGSGEGEDMSALGVGDASFLSGANR